MSADPLERDHSEDLIDELATRFLEVNKEPDWFKRLAQLAEIHHSMIEVADPDTAGTPSFISRLHKYWPKYLDKGLLEIKLRNYYEQTCDPEFPTSFLRLFWPDFLHRLVNLIQPAKGLRYSTKSKMVRVTEEWLKSAAEVPQWIHKEPQRGLHSVIRELQRARRSIETRRRDKHILARGGVIYGFSACEVILRQLFSFYGRFLYGLPGYREKVLDLYDAAADQRSQEEWERKLPELEQRYQKLEEIPPEDRKVALREFVAYVLSQRWPREHSTVPPARGLRNWKTRGADFQFYAWIELLRQLDQWIEEGKVDRTDDFEATFGREQIFPNKDEKREATLKVPVMQEDILQIVYLEKERSHEPRIIQELKSLNELRKYYVHGKIPEFLLPENSANLCDGALKVLSALIDLLERLSGQIFPYVIVPKRFIQVESDWVRMDYIGEDNPKQLHHIRLPFTTFTHLQDTPGSLLGREVYLFYQDSRDEWLTQSVYILPVDED